MPASFSGHWRVHGEHMNLAVFVNSSDGFQDCWQPFFELFRSYGGFLWYFPIYLNTERSQFDSGGINLESTKVWPVEKPSVHRGVTVSSGEWIQSRKVISFISRKTISLNLRFAMKLFRKHSTFSKPFLPLVWCPFRPIALGSVSAVTILRIFRKFARPHTT